MLDYSVLEGLDLVFLDFGGLVDSWEVEAVAVDAKGLFKLLFVFGVVTVL